MISPARFAGAAMFVLSGAPMIKGGFCVPAIDESNGGDSNRHLAERFLTSDMAANVDKALETVYRSDWGRIVASLIRLTGDFDAAEEAAQEAFAAALNSWRDAGLPQSPRAWIIQTARHKAIDRIRRRARATSTMRPAQAPTSRSTTTATGPSTRASTS